MSATMRWMYLTMLLSCFIPSAARRRPNIILMITDDQDVELGGLDHMPHLNDLLVKEGMTFRHGFVHTPVCCSSRSSILSGRYLHNGGAVNNSVAGNCYGEHWKQNAEQDTFAVHVKDAGYFTAYAGKYLNQYTYGINSSSSNNVPPGWDMWTGFIAGDYYYNYSLVVSDEYDEKPRVEYHGDDYKNDYFPNIIINRTLSALNHVAGTEQPFLVVLAWTSPHWPFTPAPQHTDTLRHLSAPRTPNYNASVTYNNQKHWMIRRQPAINSEVEEYIDTTYHNRLESLLAVDDHIKQIVEKLSQMEVLNNTFLIYMSDNGFQLGQHRLRGDKRQLYEHDIRVPFIVRGPGVPQNTTSYDIALNIDIAPTIAELATGQIPETMDGQSLVGVLRQSTSTSYNSCTTQSFRKDFLVSYHGEGLDLFRAQDFRNNTYHCVRSIEMNCTGTGEYSVNSIYCRFHDDENFVEYYDMLRDEWQLDNKADELTLDQVLHWEDRLAQLRRCKGIGCRNNCEEEEGAEGIAAEGNFSSGAFALRPLSILSGLGSARIIVFRVLAYFSRLIVDGFSRV